MKAEQMFLRQAGLKFLKESGGYKTPQSQRSMKYMLSALQSAKPGKQVGQFTEADLREFCLAPTFRGVPAPNTVRTRRANMSAFFSWAHHVGLCTSNPAASLRYTVRGSNQVVRPGKWLSEAEVSAILRACPDTPVGLRDRALLTVGFTMGFRVTELAELRWSNFSSDLSSVTFTGKGTKLATLGVPDQTREVLAAWRQHAESDVMWPHSKESQDGLRWTEALQVAGIRHAVDRAGERVGIEGLDPHDMRRSFAGLLETKGVKLEDISKLLRHNDLGTTQRYLEKNPTKVKALGQGLTFDL